MTGPETHFALSLALPGESAAVEQRMHVLVDAEFRSRLEEMEAFLDSAVARLPSEAAFSVRLCLEELIVNVITHGLQNDPDRTIRVRVATACSGDWLEIRLKDDAPAFDPFSRARLPDLTLGVDERSVGGLGIHFVKRTMNECHWHYVDGGNLIVLRKQLRP